MSRQFETIRKIYKKEHKLNLSISKKLKRLKKSTKLLRTINMTQNELILEQNIEIECITNNPPELKAEKSENVLSSSDSKIPRIITGMIICWLQLFILHRFSIVEHESFLIVNLCIFTTILLVSLY